MRTEPLRPVPQMEVDKIGQTADTWGAPGFLFAKRKPMSHDVSPSKRSRRLTRRKSVYDTMGPFKDVAKETRRLSGGYKRPGSFKR